MNDSSPIPGDETWLRVITRPDHINPSIGRITDQALKGSAFSPCADPPDDRTHELSGRRSSLCGDVDQEARAFVERVQRKRVAAGRKPLKDFDHHGTAHATAQVLRGFAKYDITSDVVHTPQPPEHDFPDRAHSDFVLRKGVDDALDEVRTFLQRTLTLELWANAIPQEMLS